MMLRQLDRGAAIFVVLAAMPGCGGAPTIAPAAAPAQRTVSLERQSWMAPDAHGMKRLLYASDQGTNDVYVYDYDTGARIGTLTGFEKPAGLCVDASGDIYVTTGEYGLGQVVEYPHGGTQPMATFTTDGVPVGCSIDPTTGNLAVANNLGSTANVQVWKNASGAPKEYSNNSDCYAIWAPPGYDDRGNLFMDTAPSPPAHCELDASKSTLAGVWMFRFLTGPAGVMWDGKYLTFSDDAHKGSNRTAIYRAVERHGKLKVVGTTRMGDRGCGVVVKQPFIVGKKNTPANHEQGTVVVGGGSDCNGPIPVSYWRYPASGPPFRRVHPGSSNVYGVAVSIAE